MVLRPGHADGERLVHLTHTTLVNEALCGAVVDHDGEPDLATPCLDCLEHARAVAAPVAVEGPAAPSLPLAA